MSDETGESKFTLIECVSRAVVRKIEVMRFKEGGSESYAVAVEFLEGPNVGKSATYFMSTTNVEFFMKTLPVIGWTGFPQKPSEIKPGKEVKATVGEDAYNGKRVMKIKFLNAVDEGNFGLSKFKVPDQQAKSFENSLMVMMQQHAKSTGQPVSTAKPAPSNNKPAAPSGGGEEGSLGDDDLPF